MTTGPNRHYIPAFLQRGFTVSKKVSKKKQEIWFFGSGQRPEKRLIKDTGSGAFFYSDLTDDVITQLETDFARALSKIRGQTPGYSVSREDAAALVAHLSMRTAHIRHTGNDLLSRVLAKSKRFFADPNNLATVTGLDADVPTDPFRNYIVNELSETLNPAALGIPPRVFERLVFFALKENSEWAQDYDPDTLDTVIDVFDARSRGVISASHDKALFHIAKQSPSEFEVFLQTLDWEIMAAPKSGAVLPDCIAIAIDEHGKADSHLFVDNDDLGAFVIAVSPDKLLVGKKSDYVMPSDFEYNIEAARLSHSFFLSSNINVEKSRLHSMLGEQLQTTLNQNLVDSFAGLRGESVSEPDKDEQHDSTTLETIAPKNFKLTLWDFEDKDESQRIQMRIGKFVGEFIKDFAIVFQIDRLAGITIANDYEALMQSVREVTDGEDAEKTPLPKEPKAGVGIGNAVLITEPDMLKTEIYLPVTVAHALVSDNPDQEAWGAHILAKHLGAVAWIGMADKCLPDGILVSVASEIDSWLYGNVHQAIKGYTMSRVGAAFGNREEIAHELRRLLMENLNWLETKVLKARRAYRRHGDMDKLLATVLPTIRNILTYAANLLGHSSSTGESPFDESGVLQDTLQRAGLSTWFNCYQDHLERFHQRIGKWESFDEFLEFNIHTERLLYAVGMFPQETPEGAVWIEIPCKIPFIPPGALYQFWMSWKQGHLRGIYSNYPHLPTAQ